MDAGVGRSEHVEAIAHALGGAPLARVLITHSHPDHVAGLPALQARWPGLRVFPEGGGGGYVDHEVLAGNRRLEIVPTPGHAPDHLCFFDRASGDLYSGDLARLGGTIVIPAQGRRPSGLPDRCAASAISRRGGCCSDTA